VASVNDLSPDFQPYAAWLLAVAKQYVGGGTLTSTRRGFFHQAALWWERSGDQVCTPGTSYHELGYAFDFVCAAGSASAYQQWLGAVWNLLFPGAWSAADPVHFSPKRGCSR